MNQKTIIFIHIPKTAGRTLNNIIRSQYQPEFIFSNGEVVASKFHSNWVKVPVEKRWELSEEILGNLPDSKKKEIKVLFGHMNFGRHKLLPQPSTYITLLRNPDDRIISHFYHIMRMENHYLQKYIKENNMTIGNFIQSGITFTVDNGQTRMISGVGDSIAFGKCTEEILDKAKANLEKYFSIVGLTEKFEQTLTLLKQKFDWKIQSYRKENVTRDRPSLEDISRNDRDIIAKYNQLDYQLYDFAEKRFQDRFQ